MPRMSKDYCEQLFSFFCSFSFLYRLYAHGVPPLSDAHAEHVLRLLSGGIVGKKVLLSLRQAQHEHRWIAEQASY